MHQNDQATTQALHPGSEWGQEEGNLRLLEKIGAGMLAESPEALRSAVADLLADDAAMWRLDEAEAGDAREERRGDRGGTAYFGEAWEDGGRV